MTFRTVALPERNSAPTSPQPLNNGPTSPVPSTEAPTRRQKGWFLRRMRWRLTGLLWGDAGMSTAEYAIGTIAAAAFAAVLYTVVTGDTVTGALTALIERALQDSF
ncbi:DUF4244 domain-containing protein [Parasphingorhabdus pacifica]